MLKVGDTVTVKPFDDAGGLLRNEYAAFKANNWRGEIRAYREWKRGNNWCVVSGGEWIWLPTDQFTPVNESEGF